MDEYEKVPWSCREEWEYCRDRLYGDDHVMQQKALEHLYVWKIRNSNLPIAVECTLILMEAKIRESLLTKGNVPDMSVAMWYSTPIMRFINLVTDSNVGFKTQNSMMDFAKKLDIPDWIVELRHAAAHGHSLPRLSKLKEATDFCLKWLRNNYWDQGLGSHYSESEQCRNVLSSPSRYFDGYRIIKLRLLQGCDVVADLSNDEKKIVLDVMPDKVRRDRENSLDSWSLVDAYEVAFKKLSRLLYFEEYAREVIDRIVTSDHREPDTSDVLRDDVFLSASMLEENGLDMAMKKWADLLNVLCNSGHLVYVLKKLFYVMGDELEYTCNRKCAFAYVNAILESILVHKGQRSNGKTNLKKKRKRQALEDGQQKTNALIVNATLTDDQIKELMLMITKNPNQFSEAILNDLCRISESDSISSIAKQFSQLIDIYTGKTIHSEPSKLKISGNSEPKVHTVQDLKELLGIANEPSSYECVGSSSKSLSESIANSTEISEKESWNNVPLGLIPGQAKFQLWMKIYETDETESCDE